MYIILALICTSVIMARHNNLMDENRMVPPPYQNSLHMLRISEMQLRKHIIHDKLAVDHPERQYALLLAVIGDAADAIASSCLVLNSTNVLYDSLDTQIPFAWFHPVSVSNQLKQFLDKSFLHTKGLIELMDVFCSSPLNVDNRNCDNVVDLIVKDFPERYSKQAELLLMMGDLAGLHVPRHVDIEKAAVNHKMVHTMFTSVRELVNFIEKLSHVLRFLYPINYRCVAP